jgi:mRNA-degrading endonuclease RelE of RelBE toxin-antitoxin system
VPYKVIFKPSAASGFGRLSQGRKKAIAKKIDELENDAQPPGAINLDGFPTLWRVTANDVRAIYHEPIGNTIYVLRIGYRSDVYEGLRALLQK